MNQIPLIRTLVFGGNRSGKSAHAEQLAAVTGREVIYLATAQAGDSEMQTRIEQHRARRPAVWRTVESPLALGAAITEWSAPQRVLLIDCLTVWLSNLLFSEIRDYPEIGAIEPPAAFAEQRAAFLHALASAKGEVILVSGEVGMGIVPQGALSRWFVDEAGRLNQDVAAICERAVFVAAGLPLLMKGAAC
ncbi:bifunctional adenosylcobinamide kinase/adenosylcobinamide-phosphate guanylyltransferase [Herbaspirillum sp. RTI4]|uniref:bifunctional adenosylcobinamide kinase/adenosylcobinamide-phosphate guanylyltransferase n=1 Tax=Herbaspirillum sp. RTI4 TaxID=3048640 RepID=UPI002AB45355|nr:bifunctional adenosylcobinamide kinase/adenosylcobinamide-phosphate guanylyltransferase [Herbaspirillum sp. RTI4]MDY7579529.1 bifunctional adenosylcobinamide kinase/adenosylcobinamide-phosphate guanylyltransferase [Herbaspirillum sp. RTI4]MEA9983157.1 bifunctional adenosylcobinamide kinase/adenosylcobinamide-phosphate guanylyltransferase [Herbaspirillum sp. RTI4]